MRTAILSSVLTLASSLALGADVAFTTKPTATRTGDQVRITFTVSAPTDVEVAILDAKGTVVRHLAAGVLGGANPPPEPLKPGLEQALLWDGKNDLGVRVFPSPSMGEGQGGGEATLVAAPPTPTLPHKGGGQIGGPFKVRVRLGLGAALERFIPASSARVTAATAIGVGPTGEVYVLSNRGHASAYVYVLDRSGKYLRTILPPPATVKPEDLKGQDRLTLADGTVVPMVFQANAAHLAPFLSGIRTQQLFVTEQGWICFASGGNDYSDQHVLRHVLVLKPDGSTPPEVGFVGPSLGPSGRYSIGLRPQQVAVSPDGKTIYFAGMGRDSAGKNPAAGIHTIGRTTWGSAKDPEPFIGKPDEPGTDGQHLNDPVSVTCDAKGSIYVADAGNNRVAAFDAAGKFLGETKVDAPAQVAVHPSGPLYVLTKPALSGSARSGPFALVKFDKAIGGREVARLPLNGRSGTFALDASAQPAKLWLGVDGRLVPVTDGGGTLTAGANVGAPEAFNSPLFLALDAARERLYVGDLSRTILLVDLKTDKVTNWMQASEPAVDRAGNVYVLSGYGTNALLKFTADGKPLPFSATGTNKIDLTYRAGLPHVGVRGLTVAPDGDLYAWEDSLKTGTMRLWRFGPDGKAKGEPLIDGIPNDSASSIAVDRAGNLYAGINVHDAKHLYPPAFGNAIPALAWERTYGPESGWYKNFPQRGVPPAPWNRMYLNYYLYHYGNVFKYPPAGGKFWVGGTPAKSGVNDRPDTVPADAREYRVGFLKSVVWEKGALWRYPGFALCSNRTESSGDPTCSCWTGRFALDESGRLFVPDVFRFSVGVLDGNGNELTRFGAYGNVDSPGRPEKGTRYPERKVPGTFFEEPAIPFAWANTVAVGGGKVYVADRISRRIAAVKLAFAAEEAVSVPGP